MPAPNTASLMRSGPGAPAIWIGAAIAAAVGALLVVAGLRVIGPRSPEPQARRFSISVSPPPVGAHAPPRIAPEGRFLVYRSGSGLAVRDLERFEADTLAGTAGASSPCWSPDGGRLGYGLDGTIWVCDRSGAGRTAICETPGRAAIHGADWGGDDRIVFASGLGGIYTVPAAGGAPRRLLAPSDGEIGFRDPQFLPDGRRVLAVARRKDGVGALVVVSYPEGTRKEIGAYDRLTAARYAPTGHLLLTFEREMPEIRSLPFSTIGLESLGEPALLLPGARDPSVASDGTLLYSAEAVKEIRLVLHWDAAFGDRAPSHRP